jgi:hypothetical protein
VLETLDRWAGVQGQKLNRTAQGSHSRVARGQAEDSRQQLDGQQIKTAVRAVAVAVESQRQRCAQHVHGTALLPEPLRPLIRLAAATNSDLHRCAEGLR